MNEFLDFAEVQRSARGRGLLAVIGRRADARYEPLERYDHRELMMLAALMGREEAVTVGDVLRRFGTRLFQRLAALYPAFISDYRSAPDFLKQIDVLTREIGSLHAGAELPAIGCRVVESGVLEVEYSSPHGLADLAEGMLGGCLAHFGGGLRLDRCEVGDASGCKARFRLTTVHLASRPSTVQTTSPVD